MTLLFLIVLSVVGYFGIGWCWANYRWWRRVNWPCRWCVYHLSSTPTPDKPYHEYVHAPVDAAVRGAQFLFWLILLPLLVIATSYFFLCYIGVLICRVIGKRFNHQPAATTA